MRDEPLFIKYLNGQVTELDVMDIVYNSSKDSLSKQIALNKKNENNDLSIFKIDFKKAVIDLIDSGINQRFINYVNSYMKPSLEEFLESSDSGRAGEDRYIVIKAEDAPWVEAVICYNLCIYIKAFGIHNLKICPVCQKFFSHKGKYAKYCSDSCKLVGQANG